MEILERLSELFVNIILLQQKALKRKEDVLKEKNFDFNLAFSRFDRNNKEYMDIEDLRKFLADNNIHKNITTQKLNLFFEFHDLDGNNQIDFKEYIYKHIHINNFLLDLYFYS